MSRVAFDRAIRLAEELGPPGEQLGNLPRAFPRPALINAAIRLDTALRRAPRAARHRLILRP